jgi:cytochrome c553
MTCPTCGNKHHDKLNGLIKCGRCYTNGRVAQYDRVGKSKGVRQDGTRSYLRDLREGTNRGGLDN